ncbi:kinase-like domain-containing protein [Aspergillus coremiiformis]|uniref:non-specific serine/threonine protein kinase n=1 Tax=Aspergillus coremiiformis TaxID=138285 RepID=A0A5N6Z688_9EURO|nr:kinase-like domain-containing protein [Aspergillus coremiiformis]
MSPSIYIDDRFKLLQSVSSGAQGQVFIAWDYRTRQKVAVKIMKYGENYDSEVKAYSQLKGLPGIPELYWKGEDDRNHIVAIELLGPDLCEMFEKCKSHFSEKTVLMLAVQLICRLQSIHSRNCVHRDIKPDNVLMGLGSKANRVYVADFGLLEKYHPKGASEAFKRDWHRCTKHPTKGVDPIGTEIYSSWRSHYEKPQQTPWDDMQSLGYMLIRLRKGRLPWEQIKLRRGTQRDATVAHMKRTIKVSELCDGLPVEFRLYFEHLSPFCATPNYDYLRKNFEKLFKRRKYADDQMYDWMKIEEEEKLYHELRQRERDRFMRDFMMHR